MRKKRSEKRLAGLLLCLSLVIGLFAGMTMAANAEDHVQVTEALDFRDPEVCKIYVPGNETNTGITWYPNGATIDGSSYTGAVLVLDGADIDYDYDENDYNYAIIVPENSTIVTIADSTVVREDTTNICAGGIYCAGDLAFAGKGRLRVTVGKGEQYSLGINSYGSLVNSGYVEATANDAGWYSEGFYVFQNITNEAGAVMIGNAGKGDGRNSIGICADRGSLTNSGKMEGNAEQGYWYSEGFYVYDGIINNAGATMTGTSTGVDLGHSYGINAGNITNNGTMTGTGGIADKAGSYGINAGNGSIINGGTMEGVGSEACEYSYGVYASDRITNSAVGVLTGTAGVSENRSTYGIYCGSEEDSITNSGNMKGTAGTARDCSCGIYAGGRILENAGASMTGIAGQAEKDDSFGIYCSTTLTNSGTIEGTGGVAGGNSWGIFAYDSMVNNAGAEMTAHSGKAGDGNSCGVFVENDSITNHGTIMGISEEASAYSVGVYAYQDITNGENAVMTGDSRNTTEANISIGIFCAGSSIINSGNITAYGGGASFTSNGIAGLGLESLAPGTITAKAGSAAEYCNGVNIDGDVTIAEGSVVNGYGADGTVECYGFTTNGNVTVGGTLNLYGGRLSGEGDRQAMDLEQDDDADTAPTLTITRNGLITADGVVKASDAAILSDASTRRYIVRNGDVKLLNGTEVAAAPAEDHVRMSIFPGAIVTFDAQGGIEVADFYGLRYGETWKEAGYAIPTTTKTEYTFLEWNTEKSGTGDTLTEDSAFEKDTTFYAVWLYSYQTFIVSVQKNAKNGTVTADKTEAGYNQPVTITAVPDHGYEVASVTVTDPVGQTVPVTDNGGGIYTFTMPAGDVAVNVTFRKAGSDEPNEPDQPDEPDQPEKADYSTCPKDDTCVYAKYTDADPQAWYHDGVHYCVQNGLMNGVSATEFAPDENLSRAMLVTILYRLEGEPAFRSSNSFSDVAPGAWYEKAVAWANSQGIVEGYGDGTFGPDDSITREQLAVILYRYAKFKGIDTTAAEDTNILSYDDAADVSAWAVTAMQWACGSGIINGKGGSLVPQGDASRAEAATMIERFCESVLQLPADTDLSVRW